MGKYLIVPENNSLSHIAKSIALKHELLKAGHEAHLAISKTRSGFLKTSNQPFYILPDIQDTDGSGFPTIGWFSDPLLIKRCIQAEYNLIKEINPDRVLGVFRFTLKAAAKMADVPYDSLIEGCMLPGSKHVLGFSKNEKGSDEQQKFLSIFYNYATVKMNQALKSLGLLPIENIRDMLRGENTFLWDFPQFCPIPQLEGLKYVGPVSWDQWNYDPINPDFLNIQNKPLAAVTFGTCNGYQPCAEKIVRLLVDMGYKVLFGSGGQPKLRNKIITNPYVTSCKFAPFEEIFPHASIVVSHGGQMTLFEALKYAKPVFVLPFQPEQAHNGVCLEKISCGKRLIASKIFKGDPKVYLNAFHEKRDQVLQDEIELLVNDCYVQDSLNDIRQRLQTYGGALEIVKTLEAI